MTNRYRVTCGACQRSHWSNELCPCTATVQQQADVSRLYGGGAGGGMAEAWRPEPWRPRVGEPAQTRDGRKARVICDDAKGQFPVVALVDSRDRNINGDQVLVFTAEGRFWVTHKTEQGTDLIPIPAKPTTITLPRNGAGIHSDAMTAFARRWETMRNSHGIEQSFAAAWDAMVRKLESIDE